MPKTTSRRRRRHRQKVEKNGAEMIQNDLETIQNGLQIAWKHSENCTLFCNCSEIFGGIWYFNFRGCNVSYVQLFELSSDCFGSFSDRFCIVSDRFQAVSDRFRNISDRFPTFFGLFSDRFRIILFLAKKQLARAGARPEPTAERSQAVRPWLWPIRIWIICTKKSKRKRNRSKKRTGKTKTKTDVR